MSLTQECAVEGSADIVRYRAQKTLRSPVHASGVGVFGGVGVRICLRPAPAGTGILFQRTDVPSDPIPATLEYVQATPRCTVLGKDGVRVQTVEHLLAALFAYEITNLIIEISAEEVPILDGGSACFVQMLEEAGVVAQEETLPVYALRSPVFWSQEGIHLVALPSPEFRVSYTLQYPDSPAIGTQFYSTIVDVEHFKKEIAPCRTFSVYEEIVFMIEKGLINIKGGGTENAVIIKENKILNAGGLHFPEEMARHKILDLIGDFSLIPVPLIAHIIAIRSGHASNNAFAKQVFNHIQMESRR